MTPRRAGERAAPELEVDRGRALVALTLALADAASERAGLELEVVRQAAELVGDAAALWRKDDDGHIDLVALSHWEPVARTYMEARAAGATHSDTVGVLPHAWQLAQPLLLDREAVQQWLPLMQPVYVEYARRFGLVSLMIVPLRASGVVVGLLGLSRDADPEHDRQDLAFVEQVAAVVATALQNERLLRQLRQHLVAQSRAELERERAGLQDPLTGLPNRRRLVSQLQTSAGRAVGEVVLVVLDVDDFQVVNASLGHEAGDEVLRELARRLDRACRRLPAGATVSRLGSDDFAVLARGAAAEVPEQDLVEVLREALVEPVAVAGRALPVRATAGHVRGPAQAAEDLLRHAQVALARARRDGLPSASYADEQDAEAEALLQAREQLDEALATGQLQVHYQPLVRRTPGQAEPRLVEALVRWRHPQRGLLLPGAFLPLVQRSGRMDALTRVVLVQALDDLAEWRRLGHDVQVSVNVTAATLADPLFLPLAQQQLAARALPADVLCLELVESEVLSPQGPQLLADVRRAGLTVALDDFGTGFSSLAYLVELPLDRLKLDRSFVRRLVQDARMQRFVAGLVDVVHGLGLPVVAEGVEQLEEARRLDALGVELQQGFLHARPQPALDLTVAWTTSA